MEMGCFTNQGVYLFHHLDRYLFVIVIILVITIIGILLLWAVGILSLVLVVVATIRASEGKLYRYPISIRPIK